MALIITSWDLATDEAQLKRYNEKSKEWVKKTLRHPGIKEFRAYRDPLRNSPEVMVHIEFDNLLSIISYLKSEETRKTTDEMIQLGCTNITNEMWDGSPLIPEPMKP